MYRKILLALLAVCAAGMATVAEAQDKWVLLGVRDVDVTLDRDRIDVTSARGRFKAVRLEAKVRGIEISKVTVTYGNGAVHNEERRINLLAGERTRPIDLRGDERFIDTVDLLYRTVRDPGSNRHAKVEVWGLQSTEGASAARPPRGGPVIAVPATPGPGTATGPIATQPTTPRPGVGGSGDVLFGSQTVGFGVDRDIIRVGAEIGKFDKVRFRVLDNAIYLIDATVIYSNGEPDKLAVNAEIPANSRTRWFTLKGDRFIKEIQLVYRNKPGFKGQAIVEVYGEYAEGWTGPTGEGRRYNQGWVLMGAQSAALRIGFEKDTFQIARNEGGFRKLRLNVKDRAITLREIRVVYGSGDNDVIPVNSTRIDAGSSFGPVDLKGGSRYIREVVLTYRSRFLDKEAKGKGAATVELWGQH